ncbi:CD109 antigen-like [Paramacrobiotus metropolitanus]|uniref:CD109 antigen-like n=1 Tax=Paramacrobiotus metropolitanus TaxID=2943436 RepID=UPI0024458D19|nr:CD109 antigen-like [Paramacrobiotus metropolitanus]
MNCRLIVGLSLLAGAANALNYVIFGLNTVRSNSVFPVSILVVNSTSDVYVNMTLTGYRNWSPVNGSSSDAARRSDFNPENSSLSFTTSAVIQANVLTRVDMKVGDFSSLATPVAYLSVSVADPTYSFTGYVTPVALDNATMGMQNAPVKRTGEPLFQIQMDQPYYKAKDMVRFRVLTVESVEDKLQPLFVPLKIQILDTQRNVVKELINVNNSEVTGYFAGEMPLSSDPLSGTWTIRVVNDSVTEEMDKRFVLASKNFSVVEFGIPRFDVTIVTNKIHIAQSVDDEIQFQLTANYTSGETVEGVFDIAVSSWYGPSLNGDEKTESTLLRKSMPTNKNETVTVLVPLKGALDNIPTYLYNALTIQANFTESATGVKKSATPAVISVQTGPYHAVFESDTGTFIPGYPYLLKATIIDRYGRPPPPIGRKAQIIATSANVSAGLWQIVPLNGDVACLKQSFLRRYGYDYPEGSSSWSWHGAVFGLPRISWGKINGFGMNGGGFGGGLNSGSRKKRDLGPFVQYSTSSCHYLPTILWADVAADGTLNVSIPTPKTADAMNILVSYDFQATKDKMVFAKQSPSGSFLDITPVSVDLFAGGVTEFVIDTTTRLNETIQILVLSNSNASFLWSDSVSTPGQRITVSVPLTDAIGPVGRLIAYYVRKDSEIVGNIIPLQITNVLLSEQVTLFVTSKNGQSSAQPGEKVTVKAKTGPFSTVAFLAIEERRSLFKADNDISDSFIGKTKRVSNAKPGYRLSIADYFTTPLDSGRVQHFLLTNTKGSATGPDIAALVWSRAQDAGCSCPTGEYRYGFRINTDDEYSYCSHYCQYQARDRRVDADGTEPKSSSFSGDSISQLTRQHFPQSFLFETALADANGDVILERNVPDALTTWRIWAFSLSSTGGLIASATPVKLKVFQPLIASLDLPYSVIHNENFTAEVVISNHIPQKQELTVNLTTRKPDNTITTFTKNIISLPNDTIATVFTIISEQIGEWELEVTVKSALASHQLKKTLLVKSEGVQQFYSQPVLIDLHKSSAFDTVIQLPIDPADKVSGSEKVTVAVVGDILAVSISNLDKLIRLPSGGGEPNMAIVASSATMLKHLRNTNRTLPQKEKNLVSNIQLRYQQALSYLRSDHSFSMWGASDTNGSTWLTAYVTRVFAETSELLPNSSAAVIKKAVQFLLDQQNNDGSFRESGGKVQNSYTESGDSKLVSLTAFTVLSFTEYIKTGRADTEKLDASIQKAVEYLESHLENVKRDSYALAITAYALAQANSSKSLDALNRLKDVMVYDVSTVRWKNIASADDDGEDNSYSYSTHAKDVETTAYALLAHMANGDRNISLKIASWLISKQNTEGGFFSTADTAVAVEALAEFAQSFTDAPSIQIDITNGLQKSDMAISPETSMVVHSSQFEQKPTDIAIHARGSGIAVAYISWTYNVLQPVEGWAFDLNVTLSRTGSAKAHRLNICTRYWKDGASSLTLMEVSALSGYQFDEEEVKQLPPAVKSPRKSELDNEGSKLNLYYEEMTPTAICFSLTMHQTHKVENLKAQSVVIYDYYNPKDRRTVFYS